MDIQNMFSLSVNPYKVFVYVDVTTKFDEKLKTIARFYADYRKQDR